MDKQYRITREEAIQILSTRDAHGVLCGYTSGVTEALDMAIEALQDRSTGEWVEKNSHTYICSDCGFEQAIEVKSNGKWYYTVHHA